MSATQPSSGVSAPPALPTPGAAAPVDDKASVQASVGNVQNAGIPANPPITPTAPANTPTETNQSGGLTEQERKSLAEEVSKVLERSKHFKKMIASKKEDKNIQNLQLISGALLSKNLNFEMKVDQKNNKVVMECTNFPAEVKQFESAIKATKRIKGSRGRGRGRVAGRGGRGKVAVRGGKSRGRSRSSRRKTRAQTMSSGASIAKRSSARRGRRGRGRGRSRGRGGKRIIRRTGSGSRSSRSRSSARSSNQEE